MAVSTTARDDNAGMLAKAAVGLGALAIIAFFGLGFAMGGWWFALAFVIGIGAVAAGWIARSRGADQRRLATIGMVLGAIPVVWFVSYIILDAIF